MAQGQFLLTFYGSKGNRYPFPKYRSFHRTYKDARDAAYRVYEKLAAMDIPPSMHKASVFGPGMGYDGTVIGVHIY